MEHSMEKWTSQELVEVDQPGRWPNDSKKLYQHFLSIRPLSWKIVLETKLGVLLDFFI